MLGPSMILAGTPLAIGYSGYAKRYATNIGLAEVAYRMSVYEAIGIVLLIIALVVATGG